MSKPYDATMKYLLEHHPTDWLTFLGLPDTDAELVEAELSTVTAGADKVIRIKTMPASILHLEFQSGYDAKLDKRMLRYNVLLDYEHEETIESAVILLTPSTERSRITEHVERWNRNGSKLLNFNYRVLRIWELPVETILAGPIGVLPLAPLSYVASDALPEVIRRMDARFHAEATSADAGEMWTGAYVLMGLRYPDDLTEKLLKGVRGMQESATYRKILREGEARGEIKGEAIGEIKGERKLILRQGRKRFGEPDEATIAALEAITSIERLEQIGVRLLEVESWTDLLA